MNCIEKVCGNNVDFFDQRNYTYKSAWKQRWFFRHRNHIEKLRENNVDFPTIEVTSKRVRGDDVDFLISEITSKKVVETTWKLVEIWSWTYRRNVDVESAWIWRGVFVGKFQFREWHFSLAKAFFSISIWRVWNLDYLQSHMFCLLKGRLMQIWKSVNSFGFTWK